MPSFKESLPMFEPADAADLRRWLAANHDRSAGVWLVLHKQSSDGHTIGWDAVVEEALCFGWIDSVPNKLDAHRYKLMLTPRKPGSVWSKVNKARIDKLLAEGRMTPAGQAKIDAAIADGSWDKLNESDSLAVPAELQAALDAVPQAAARFAGFSPSARKQILEWVLGAKTEGTRAKRIAETVRMAAMGLRANYPADLKKLPR